MSTGGLNHPELSPCIFSQISPLAAVKQGVRHNLHDRNPFELLKAVLKTKVIENPSLLLADLLLGGASGLLPLLLLPDLPFFESSAADAASKFSELFAARIG